MAKVQPKPKRRKKRNSTFRTTACKPVAQGHLDNVKIWEHRIGREQLKEMYALFVNPQSSEFELEMMDLTEMRKLIACAIWARVKARKGLINETWLEKIAWYVGFCTLTVRNLCVRPKKKPSLD